MPRRAARSRHTTYHELFEACRSPGCAVCTLAQAAVARYLEAVLYEGVNDPPTRDAIVAARGFCNDHAWMLREMSSALGAALLCRDVLRNAAVALRERGDGKAVELFGSPAPAGVRATLATLAGRAQSVRQREGDPHLACTACVARAGQEELYLRELVAHLDDGPFAARFAASGGLCLVHLDQAGRVVPDRAALSRLYDAEATLLSALHDELSEFVRKNDYRFVGEGMGPERDSWIRAIERIAGKPGIR